MMQISNLNKSLQKTAEQVIGKVDDLATCDDCELCVRCTQRINQIIVDKAYILACNTKFQQECKALDRAKAKFEKELKASSNVHQPKENLSKRKQDEDEDDDEDDDDEDDDGDENEIEIELEAPPKKVAQKTLVRNPEPNKAPSNVTTKKRKVTIKATKSTTAKTSTTKIASAKPPTPTTKTTPTTNTTKPPKKRNADDEFVEDVTKNRKVQDESSYVENPKQMSLQEYTNLQKMEAEESLRDLLTNVERTKAIYMYDNDAKIEIPAFDDPSPNLSKAENVSSVSGMLLLEFLNIPKVKKGGESNAEIAVNLGNSCKFINKCFMYAGFMKLYGKYKPGEDVGYYQRAMERYNKIMYETTARYNNLSADLKEKFGTFEMAKPINALKYAQLGDFFVKYPMFLFQTRFINFNDWTEFIIKKTKSSNKNIERPPKTNKNLYNFFEEILAKDKELADFWSQPVPSRDSF